MLCMVQKEDIISITITINQKPFEKTGHENSDEGQPWKTHTSWIQRELGHVDNIEEALNSCLSYPFSVSLNDIHGF